MFNENQRRYLLSRLRSIDETLSEAVERLAPSDSGRVFRSVSADATPSQRKILADYLAQVRFALRRFMLAHQLRDERRPTGGLWSLQTAVVFAGIAAEELRPKYWRGYGEVDPSSAAAAERFAAELTTLFHRMEAYLARGEGGGIAARLERLSGARDEIALLKELERVISAHGLTELRAPLETLVDRAAAPRFEIAVFGRVSAGKSSLLNWWLGQPLLPTGITPVTSVPTCIVHGETARVRIERSSGAPLEIPIAELAAFVSEQGNPGNEKRVLSVLIEAPSERLRGGIRLVDTPGLGSLATAGAAQTLEYLPQCDLGILLIEAGAPVAPDDLDVARALVDGGSDVVIALSKADRLSGTDLEQALAYVEAQFETRLSMPLTVRPISTIRAQSALAQEWFDRMLAPRLASHTERAAEALRRKIAVLRESVVALLDARLRAPQGRSAAASAVERPDGSLERSVEQTRRSEEQGAAPLHERIAQARSDFRQARSQLLDLKLWLPRYDTYLLESAADELARCWIERARVEEGIVERVEAAIARRADETGHAVARMLDELRDDVVGIVEECGARSGERGTARAERSQRDAKQEAQREIARPRGRPVFDVGAVMAARPDCRPLRWLPRWSRIARLLARARVRRTMLEAVSAQLGLHGEALHRWGLRYLDDLTRRFDAAIAMTESAARVGADRPMTDDAEKTARRDLERLQQWPADAA